MDNLGEINRSEKNQKSCIIKSDINHDRLDDVLFQNCNIRDTSDEGFHRKNLETKTSIFNRLKTRIKERNDKKKANETKPLPILPSNIKFYKKIDDVLTYICRDAMNKKSEQIFGSISHILIPKHDDKLLSFDFCTKSPDDLYNKQIVDRLKSNVTSELKTDTFFPDDIKLDPITPKNILENLKQSNDDVLIIKNQSKDDISSNLPSYCVCGDVDSGKSTLVGQFITNLGSKKNYKKSTINNNDDNIAWICDSLDVERDKGITIHSMSHIIDYGDQRFALVDSPGHVDFTKSMIESAQKSNSALLVVDGSSNVYEDVKFIDLGTRVKNKSINCDVNMNCHENLTSNGNIKNQTIEHLMILKTFGIKTIIVAVNKLEVVQDDVKDHFEYIKMIIMKILKRIGYKAYHFVPISAKNNINILDTSKNIWQWYDSKSIFEFISMNNIHHINVKQNINVHHHEWPPILCVISKYNISKKVTIFLCHIVGDKTIKKNDTCYLNNKLDKKTSISAINHDNKDIPMISPSDYLQINVKLNDLNEEINIGDCLFIKQNFSDNYICTGSKFCASVFTFNSKIPITIGMEVKIFVHFANHICKIIKMKSIDGKQHKRVIKSYEKALIEFKCNSEIVFLPFNEKSQILTNFLIYKTGQSLGAGKFISFEK